MAKKNVVSQEDFDALLSWLDVNRDVAAQKYERIRQRLIRIFAGRGCFDAEELTDETINRVTLKSAEVAANYVGEPALYFYGVANHVHQEWLRKQTQIKNLQFVEKNNDDYSDFEIQYECLKKCLETLPSVHRYLIIEYYQNEKRAKIEHRQELAEQIGISHNALQIKTCRIRAVLHECVKKCAAVRKP